MVFDIREELKKLPDKPGVYLMKDKTGDIIYVGKAISLKNRVRQYFQFSKNKTPKVNAMVERIVEFETILTDNEVEALILEANLIKKHKPKYNILLRDDKQYPYIKITTNEKYPRVIKTRNIKKDGCKYFGPYVSNMAVNDTIEIIKNLYQIRTCRLNLDKDIGKKRPCLNYHINKCLGPCQGNVDEDNYMKMIDEIAMFLNGREDRLINIIQKKMEDASKNMDFESAAKYRDQIKSLNHILEQQKIVSTTMTDQDIIAMARGIDEVCMQIFFVRSGKLIGRESYIITGTDGVEKGEIISSFGKQFYMGVAYIPKEILVEEEFEDIEVIAKWLTERKGFKVNIKMPKRGDKNLLMEMVRKNAIETLKKSGDRIRKNTDEGKEAVKELAGLLKFKEIPKRIEAFDISNTQGVESVGSMVVFENGVPKKSDYRRFKIKTIIGPNDYGSMEEVIYRRFDRGIQEKQIAEKNKLSIESFSNFPDLLLVDGGKGQMKMAKRVLKEFNIDIPVCGLVKDDFHRTRGIIYEDNEMEISKYSKSFKLITRIQDEAHRFAINYHRSLRDKSMVKSILDDIKGIGKKRKISLMKSFGSIDNIRNASIKELISVDGMNKNSAEAVYKFFRKG